MGLVSRCGRLRTLVLVLEDLYTDWRTVSDVTELAARLPALAWGAPALRALQLVLPFPAEPDSEDEPGPEGELGQEGELDPAAELGALWSALEALPNLASLALGWVSPEGEQPALTGYCIARMLDAVQVGPAAPVLISTEPML